MKRFRLLSELWAPFKKSGISIYAAGASFFLALSLLPASILAFSALPYFHGSAEFLSQLLVDVIPVSFHPLLDLLLKEIYSVRSLRVLSLSALTTLWSASKGILAIMDGLNATLSLPLTKGYVRRQLLAIFYFLILSSCLLIMLIGFVFGNALLALLLNHLPGPKAPYMLAFRFRGVNALLLLGAIFSLIYWLLPSKKVPYKHCLRSGFLTAISWILLSYGFSFYIHHISGHSKFYGNMSILLLAALWLRICVALLLYGGLYAGLRNFSTYRPGLILKKVISRSE